MKNITAMISRQYRIFEQDIIPFGLMRTALGRESITKLFGFSGHGEDPSTGDLIFQSGAVADESGSNSILVRLLQLNERRIIIEVAGSSEIARLAYGRLIEGVSGFFGDADLQNVEPIVFTEETQCAVTLESDLPRLLPPVFSDSVLQHILQVVGPPESIAEIIGISFAVTIRYNDPESKFRNASITLADKKFSFETRPKSHLADRVFLTTSPTSSDTHLELFKELDEPSAQEDISSRKPDELPAAL